MRLYDETIAGEKCKAEDRATGEDLLCNLYEDRKLLSRHEEILNEYLREEMMTKIKKATKEDLEELLFYDGEEIERNKITIKILQRKISELKEIVKTDLENHQKELDALKKIDPELRGDEALDYEWWSGVRSYAEKINMILK